METQQKKQPIHVGYEVHAQYTKQERVNTLEIKTPLWVLIVTYKFVRSEFYQLVDSLRTKFSYKDDEIVPLELPNHELDFIMITEEADATKQFGVSFTDADGGIDGHELEIAQYVMNFYTKLNNLDKRNCGIGQIYSGIESYTESLTDYMNNSPGINISITNKDCVYNVTIDLSNLKITFVLYEEECIPSNEMHDN